MPALGVEIRTLESGKPAPPEAEPEVVHEGERVLFVLEDTAPR